MSRPFIPAPNQCSVEMMYLTYASYTENQFHVVSNAPFTLANLVSLRNVFITWHGASWKGLQNISHSLIRVRSKALDAADGPLDDYTLPAPVAGTRAGNLLPPYATFAVKLMSESAGRSARGRIYCTGLSYNDSDTFGNMTSAYANNRVAGILDLMSRITAANANWHLCITSFRANKAWRAEGVPYIVTSVGYSDLYQDVQRRRAGGRGPG